MVTMTSILSRRRRRLVPNSGPVALRRHDIVFVSIFLGWFAR